MYVSQNCRSAAARCYQSAVTKAPNLWPGGGGRGGGARNKKKKRFRVLQGRRIGLGGAEPVEVSVHRLQALPVLAALAEEEPEADGEGSDANSDENANHCRAETVVRVRARLEPVEVGRGLADHKAADLDERGQRGVRGGKR